MTPDDIVSHGRRLRRAFQRVAEDNPSYAKFGPMPTLLSAVDDMCELIIALAQNLKEKETSNANEQ